MKILRRHFPVITAIAIIAGLAATTAQARPSLTRGEIPEALRASFVTVEITPQSHEGEDPQMSNLANALRQESTIDIGSYLVTDDLVIVADDACFPDRFIRSWRVRQGAHVTDARVIARAADRASLLLKLDKPLPGARPLQFVEPVEGAGLALHWTVDRHSGIDWEVVVRPLSASEIRTTKNGDRFFQISPGAIITTASGNPVSITSSMWMKADDSWKTPWKAWKWIYHDDFSGRLEKLSASTGDALLCADINLRPLPVRAGDNPYQYQDNDPSKKPHPAIVISPKRVLVLTPMTPALTARLEGVTLRIPAAKLSAEKTIKARFVATLADYGAFVVEPEEPLETALTATAAGADWSALRDQLLFTVDLRMQGDNRLARPGCTRVLNVEKGWKNLAVPVVSQQAQNLVLFDLDGRFLGCSLAPRMLAQERVYFASRPVIVSAAQLAQFAGDIGGWADASNIPVAAAEERQLVWLGVDLQSLTRELAQAQGVAEQTQNGGNGALVTKVHPGSPAERCGLKTGDVLLRMRRQDNPQVIPIRPGYNRSMSFMYSRGQSGQQIPESMFDRIPPPWPVADNPLNQKLKELGVGKVFEIDYARDGEFATATFTAEKGPEYFGTAPESVFEAGGLNVKALTFETRSFYKVPEGDAALIVSRVVAGSRASVAGLQPYDLILAINDHPVTTPADFEKTARAGGKLRLLTRRMSQTRIVTLEIEETKKASSE